MSTLVRVVLSLGGALLVAAIVFAVYRAFIDPEGYAPVGVVSAVVFFVIWHFTGRQTTRTPPV